MTVKQIKDYFNAIPEDQDNFAVVMSDIGVAKDLDKEGKEQFAVEYTPITATALHVTKSTYFFMGKDSVETFERMRSK